MQSATALMDESEAERRHAPMRRCVATGVSLPKARLLRFVVSPGGEVVPDVAERLPGRGLWVTPRRALLEGPQAKRQFARAARRAVVVPDDLGERVEGLLVRRCLDLVGLTRRAGAVSTGFEQVRRELKRGRVRALLTASDAASGGADKLEALVRAAAPEVVPVRLFEAAELAAALGGAHVVHAALAPGGATERFLAEARRLAAYRDMSLDGKILQSKTKIG